MIKHCRGCGSCVAVVHHVFSSPPPCVLNTLNSRTGQIVHPVKYKDMSTEREQQPSIGRVIHYVDMANGFHVAALVTQVAPTGVYLTAFPAVLTWELAQSATRLSTPVLYDPTGKRGTWHWPERE